jgi:hypothetical protein
MDTDTRAQQDWRYPDAKFNEKGCLQVWDRDALMAAQTTHVSWPFNYKLFCVMTILELNGNISYLGYVS